MNVELTKEEISFLVGMIDSVQYAGKAEEIRTVLTLIDSLKRKLSAVKPMGVELVAEDVVSAQ